MPARIATEDGPVKVERDDPVLSRPSSIVLFEMVPHVLHPSAVLAGMFSAAVCGSVLVVFSMSASFRVETALVLRGAFQKFADAFFGISPATLPAPQMGAFDLAAPGV